MSAASTASLDQNTPRLSQDQLDQVEEKLKSKYFLVPRTTVIGSTVVALTTLFGSVIGAYFAANKGTQDALVKAEIAAAVKNVQAADALLAKGTPLAQLRDLELCTDDMIAMLGVWAANDLMHPPIRVGKPGGGTGGIREAGQALAALHKRRGDLPWGGWEFAKHPKDWPKPGEK